MIGILALLSSALALIKSAGTAAAAKGLSGFVMLSETQPAPTPATMDTLLDSVGSFVSHFVEWVIDIAQAMVSNPLLLLFVVAIPVGFAVVAMVKGFISRRGK